MAPAASDLSPRGLQDLEAAFREVERRQWDGYVSLTVIEYEQRDRQS